MLRSLILGIAVIALAATPALANKGQEILKKRMIEADQRAQSEGYTPVTFAQFKAGADGWVSSGQKIALPVGGFVFDANGNGYIYPAKVDEDGESFDIDKNEVLKVPVWLKASPPEIQALFFEQCTSVDFCSVKLVGHATQCKWTNVFGNTTNTDCFAVEKLYGTKDMVEQAVAANRASFAAPQTVPPTNSITIVNPGPTSPLAPNSPATQQASLTGGGESSFERGHADRVLWERFFNGLSGEDRDGALWWASTRSTSQRGACHGSPFFMRGCVAAKAFLDLVDAQRLTDPAYRLGFNTYP